MKKIYQNNNKDMYIVYEGKALNIVIVFNDESYSFLSKDNCYFIMASKQENYKNEEMKPQYRRDAIKEVFISKKILEYVNKSNGK